MAHDNAPEKRSSISKEGGIDIVEDAQTSNEELWIQEYDLLRSKSKEELALLNKKVVKKLDWRFLTTITAMLLMKCEKPTICIILILTPSPAILIALMFPTLALPVCRKTQR
jgi:hypothetical protein